MRYSWYSCIAVARETVSVHHITAVSGDVVRLSMNTAFANASIVHTPCFVMRDEYGVQYTSSRRNLHACCLGRGKSRDSL